MIKRASKNIIISLLCLILSFGLIVPAYAAQESNEDTVNIDKFLENATVEYSSSSVVTLKSTNTISEKRNYNSTEENMVDTYVSFVFPNNDAYEKINNRSTYSSNNYKELWDSSGQIKVYSRVYYTQSTYNGNLYVKFTDISGGISAGGTGDYVGSNVYIINNSVNYGAFGENKAGATVNYSNQKVFSNSARSWSISIPSPDYVLADASGAFSGATYLVRLQRGSSTWSVQLTNDCF